MTAIAVKDGIVAADTAFWRGSIIIGHAKKIERLKDGRLFVATGVCSLARLCCDWLSGEAERPGEVEEHDFSALVLGRDTVWRVDRRFTLYVSPSAPFHVEGAHGELLIGAMAAGASAEQAVRLAIQYGDSAGGDVQVEKIDRGFRGPAQQPPVSF